MICMNQSGSKLKIKIVKLFVVPSTDIQMAILCPMKNFQLTNENKEVYLCGDFNSNNNYNKIYGLMCSYGFLPQIHQPTRIQGATIIDNIFTDTCDRKIL